MAVLPQAAPPIKAAVLASLGVELDSMTPDKQAQQMENLLYASFGANWIPAQVYQDFAGQLLQSEMVLVRYDSIYSLEIPRVNGIQKADIFRKRTVRRVSASGVCSSPEEGLMLCLERFGRVELGWIAEQVV